MKKILPFWMLLVSLQALGQGDCYLQAPFDVWSEYDVDYGSDIGFAGQVVPLRMNIHRPVADNNPERPAIVFIHGGGFIEGNKNDLDEICIDFAARGYTAVTISYRLGMQKSDLWGDALPCGLANGPVCGYILDQNEVYRAFYRGVQDARGAIRYVKNSIDSVQVDQVFVAGFSAGAFIALGAAYLDQAEVNSTAVGALSPAPFLAPSLFGGCYPANASTSRPALGSVQGTQGFNGPHDASVRGVLSFAGAVFDPAWIQANDVPLYLMHNTLDGVVPMDYGQIYAPAVDQCAPFCANMNNNYPFVYGPQAIAEHVRSSLSNALRFKLELVPCVPDCTTNGYCHNINPNLADCLFDDAAQFMSDILCTDGSPRFVECQPMDERDVLWNAQDDNNNWCVQGANEYPGLVYRTAVDAFGDTVELALDLYVPRWLAADEKRPLIVFFHGGGFTSLTENRSSFAKACRYFSSLGYITASADYRIRWPGVSDVPCENDFQEYRKAAFRAWQDSREAINFLIDRHQLLHIDTHRVAVAGYSAGALLSLLNGYTSAEEMDMYDASLSAELGAVPELRGTIEAVVSIAGAMPDFENMLSGPERPALQVVQGTCDQATSPGYDPPFFCSNFTEKMLGGECLATAAASFGVSTQGLFFEGMDHFYFSYPEVQEEVEEFSRYFLYHYLLCETPGQPDFDVAWLPFSSEQCYDYGGCPILIAASEVNGAPAMQVFPNPGTGQFHVQLDGQAMVQVIDLNGNLLHGQTMQEEGTLSLDWLPDGIYLLHGRMLDGTALKPQKLVILR